MLFYPTVREGVAWLLAKDESWAQYAAAKYAAAVERGDADEDDGTT